MPQLTCTTPDRQTSNTETAYDLNSYEKKFLAQGDSWFSIGSYLPFSTSSILLEMRLEDSAIVVNCARPGSTLQHMIERISHPVFLNWLNGIYAERWDALLISGGGNDIIDAACSPTNSPIHLRLFRNRDEWLSETGTKKYISETGIANFFDQLHQAWTLFLKEVSRSKVPNVPIFVHTYDYITPRNVRVHGSGPWVYRAMDMYNIPKEDWNALSDELINRLALFWLEQQTITSKIFIVNTIGTLARAQPDQPGSTRDWANEIHPSSHGYKLLAAEWGQALDTI